MAQRKKTQGHPGGTCLEMPIGFGDRVLRELLDSLPGPEDVVLEPGELDALLDALLDEGSGENRGHHNLESKH
jgi:hypothetical protein